MSTTIPGLPDSPLPLTGAERVPIDPNDGVHTYDASTGDIAKLGALYAATQPETLDAAATYFTTQGAGDPLTTWFPPTVATVAGFGPAATYTGAGSLYTRGVRVAPLGRVWEVEAVVEQVSVGGGETPTARLGIRALKNDFTDTAGTPEIYGAASAALTAGQIVTLTYRFSDAAPYGGAAWANPSTAVWLRPVVQVNNGGAGSSVARVRRLTVRDVTATVNQAASGSTGKARERFKTAAIVAGVLAIDFSQSNFWVVPLNADLTTFTVTGKPPAGEADGVTVVFVADGTARSIAGLNAVVKWLGLSNPTFTNTNTYENWCVFFMRDNVQRVVGSFSGAAAP